MLSLDTVGCAWCGVCQDLLLSLGPLFQLYLMRLVGPECEIRVLTLSLNPQGSSRCRSCPSVATQSMKTLRTRWAPPWGWSYTSRDLKCRKGSVPYCGAEVILQGHFLAGQLAFTSSLDFLAVWKALAKTLHATGLGYGFNSQARGDVLILSMWVWISPPFLSSCSSPLSLALSCSFRGWSVFCWVGWLTFSK